MSAQAARCPDCRLVIGAGRVLPPGQGLVGAGTNAGIRASQARRAEADPVDPARVRAAIKLLAQRLEQPCLRVRMVDYDQHVEEDPGRFPALPEVLATYGSWKRARQAAHEELTAERRGTR